MSDRRPDWKRISAEFDRAEPDNIERYLLDQGVDPAVVPDSVGHSAAELLQVALGGEDEAPELSRYRIRERLETGGQSEIYLAERSDGVYHRTVVIKFIADRYGQELLRRQFLEEMQLLADLNHPGIVQILDGGLTENDQPWLVLDHIDGRHLDAWCSEGHLGPRDVVPLFLDLCDALDHVHRRGVVHMDLKPTNVLIKQINGTAFPVVIDFGIALRSASLKPGTKRPPFGTPGFAAPEQLAGRPVDQRADIWSMGMMLAQVLTRGRCDNIGLLEANKRQTLLRKQGVPADLIDVITTCTRERPGDRYPSMDTLRTDLNNWRHDYPLIANRNRPLHVAAKSVRRHPLIFATALLVLASAAAFTGKYTRDIHELQQRTLAEKTAGDALLNFISNDLFERLVQIGRVDVLQLVAERSLAHLGAQDQRTYDAAAWLQTAIAYTNAGKVFDALEVSDQALAAFDQALLHLRQIEQSAGHRRPYLRQAATVHTAMGRTLATEGQGERTESSLLRALELADRLITEFPDEDEDLLWEAHIQLGWHYMEYGRPDEADAHIAAAMATAQRRSAPDQDGLRIPAWTLNLSQAWQARAWHAFDYGAEADALAAIGDALSLARLTLEFDHEDIEYLDNYRILLNQQAFLMLRTGRTRSADEAITEAIATGERLQILTPENRKYQRELAYSYTTAGEAAEQQGDLEAALGFYQRSLELSGDIAQADPAGYSSANDYAIDLTRTAHILIRKGQEPQARELLNEAVNLMRPIQRGEPDNKYYLHSLAVPLILLGRYDEARPLVDAVRAAGLNDAEFTALLSEHGLD
ncbi:serine/threonine-protein kinase [Elongatibacter sediminis]|uniref:Serine/threonine-protein kinase n=1 Tax=Elongatibacter sediminis TaxID=3119006 RepID=A0AAW9R7U5_9GAMM